MSSFEDTFNIETYKIYLLTCVFTTNRYLCVDNCNKYTLISFTLILFLIACLVFCNYRLGKLNVQCCTNEWMTASQDWTWTLFYLSVCINLWVLFECIVYRFTAPQFITTGRGNPLLLTSKYRYVRHRTSTNGKIRWICSSQSSRRCKAWLWTLNNVIYKGFAEHTHPSQPRKKKDIIIVKQDLLNL